MSVFSTAERRRYDGLRARGTSSIKDVVETKAGFALRLDATVPPSDIAEWMALERRCCPFIDINLAIKRDQTTWVELSGDEGIQDFLRHEFARSSHTDSIEQGLLGTKPRR